jgi:hypothetical protein
VDILIGVVVVVVFALVGLTVYETPLAPWGRMLSRWWLAHRPSGWPPRRA